MAGRSNKKVKALILDYDCTITVEDTTYLAFQATKLYQEASPAERNDLQALWQGAAVHYMNGYQVIVQSFLQNADHNGIKECEGLLKALDAHSYSCALHLAEQHIFDCMERKSIPALAESVLLAQGALDLVRKANEILGTRNCRIVSVNWLPELIHCSILNALPMECIHAGTVPVLDCHVTASARKLKHTENTVAAAQDKQGIIKNLRSEIVGCGAIVYVGDSLTDIPALLEADIGIVVGRNSTLFQVASNVGIIMKQLGDCTETVPWENLLKENKPALYIANSLEEVGRFLFG